MLWRMVCWRVIKLLDVGEQDFSYRLVTDRQPDGPTVAGRYYRFKDHVFKASQARATQRNKFVERPYYRVSWDVQCCCS